jgi:hypothetical protein
VHRRCFEPPPRELSLDPAVAPFVTGQSVILTGTGFGEDSVVIAWTSTAGTMTAPEGWTPTSLTWQVPFWLRSLGDGILTIQVVNTNQASEGTGHARSEERRHFVYRPATDSGPMLLAVDGVPLNAFDPAISFMSIDTVLVPGTTIEITGTGFDLPIVNLHTTEGNLGPLRQTAISDANRVRVAIPETLPAGPGALQVVNRRNWSESNSVSVVLGEVLDVASVVQGDDRITVTGTGFSSASVVGFFAQGPNGLENFGGLDESGGARIPLTIVSTSELSLPLPGEALAGRAYVMVLNPPFTDFTSTRGDPDGSFVLSAPDGSASVACRAAAPGPVQAGCP